ncbi:MtrAB system histidine kinase MtrB [Thermocrispum municipale]|jgi:two-component system sensor histidine kinase MtrB|uniref:MtrAB system histidine kinase MtrB n=1 Tax=Thermocrispum municipale TaxID=37926 RepID=UPI0009FFE3B1|nr:MtrAB system histidine kinase MtrB [Thermocrispum municipale]
MAAVGDLWRSSLQFKVTVSTLALSSAVVFVLVMVLQYQIAERLLDAKEKAALAQARSVLETARNELAGVDISPETLRERLDNARKQITFSAPSSQDPEGSAAGIFEPVLVGGTVAGGDEPIAAGDYWKVPEDLRRFVEQRQESQQIHTVQGKTYLIIGEPMTAATGRPLQLYLLFPLTAEQNTVNTVQNTFLVGGFVLLLLVASIANLVTRQVVLPVRRAATAAARFAEGDFDQRLPVAGTDDLSKLAVSYNEMAESIQQQIQQLEEFGQLQRRFTSDVSHELRTPLTTVRMAADVLHASREQFPTGLARSAELLVDELDRFEALLGDLLEISRLDAGVEELSAEFIDLRPIVERVREQVRVLAGTAGTPIELVLPEAEASAEVDARRVERILRNLLANAVDHSEGKPVRLIMAVSDDAVAIAVRDYGVGLRPGEEELVFNRFWRADPSRNRHTGGTGLGLAISQEDARLHGGELVAWGEPGKGACFRLTLPREQGNTVTSSPLPLPPDPPEGSPNGSATSALPSGDEAGRGGDRAEVSR